MFLAGLLFSVPACSRPRALADKAPSPKGPATLLTPSASELDFGTVARGARSEQTFRLHNPGPAAVTVSRVETSCDCFRVRLERRTLGPGEETSATAWVDFSGDPGFAGKLLLQATGLVDGGAVSAFALRASVEVR